MLPPTDQVNLTRITCAAFFFAGLWDMEEEARLKFLDMLEAFEEGTYRDNDMTAKDWVEKNSPNNLLHYPFENSFMTDIKQMYEDLVQSICTNILKI